MAATEEGPSYFSMPGAFHSEGVHPGLIRPPASPAGTANSPIFASAILTPASPSTPSALPRPKFRRRRPTGDFAAVHNSPTNEDAGARRNLPAASHNNASSTSRSYVLAGDLATPGAGGGPGMINGLGGTADQGIMGESMFSDSDYRTVLGSKRRRDDIEPDHTAPPTLYTLPSEPSPKGPGWGSFAFSTLGGVVGKVWDFCWGGSFKGFHAGEGRGYDAPDSSGQGNATSPNRGLPGAWDQEDDGSDTELAQSGQRYSAQDKKNQPEEDYDPSASYSRASTPTRQSAKRRHTDKTDDLGRNWVVINQNDPAGRGTPAQNRPSAARSGPSTRPRVVGATPTSRRVTSASMSRTPTQTPVSRSAARRSSSRGGRYSVAGNAWERPAAASTASFASPRSSPGGTSREPTFHDSLATGSPARRRTGANTAAPESRPQRPNHRRTNSNASAATTRSPHGQDNPSVRRQSSRPVMALGDKPEDGSKKQSPRLDEEARRLASKRRHEERAADIRMTALNRQLQDMIRQGKEALGTTVDVEMDGGKGGSWEDDE
ncbi:hypothetical protein CC79DRAFT_1370588 [Sarocladium strictum]